MSREYMIRCPYCFMEFHQEHTIFRASRGFDRSELELGGSGMGGLLGGTPKSSNNNAQNLFQKFDTEDSTAANKKLDVKLIDFWKDRGGSSGYVTVNRNWDYPHLDPQNKDIFNKMVSKNPVGSLVPGEDGFVRDRDGFITHVLDQHTHTAQPATRICPGCHNPLPTADYGKYPVKFISVVGITGAGKTVFLNQLLTRFDDVIHGTGFIKGAHNLDAIGESVAPGFALPAATDDKIMRHPLAVTLLKVDQRGQETDGSMTLVFYDIAGENCVSKNGDQDLLRAKATIGEFIAKCDGLIFLLDPEQIPSFAEGDVRPNNISNVVAVMSNIRTLMNTDLPNWNSIPVAVCLAKSDKLNNKSQIPNSDAMFSWPDRQIKGFHRDQNFQISQSLKTFLEQNAGAVVSPLHSFPRKAFFAVSAITCGVESRFEKYKNQYILDNDNAHKFRKLQHWANGWNERTPEERDHYIHCPIRQQDGTPIQLPKDARITERNARDIITEVRGDTVDGMSEYLTLWDVASEINLVGYPVADPNPRRIGDPLKWILWKLGIIGPYFEPEAAGSKPIFMSQKKWQARLDELDAMNEYNRSVWYGEDQEGQG